MPLEQLDAGMSEKHCGLIRRLPCAGCGRIPAGTIHHLKSGEAGDHRGVGMRAPDRFGVPLCWGPPSWCHPGLEAIGSTHELAWFAERGIADPLQLAADLWRAFLAGGYRLQSMTTIVISHREGFAI